MMRRLYNELKAKKKVIDANIRAQKAAEKAAKKAMAIPSLC